VAGPDVPGLVFRRYRGDEDLPLIVEVFEAVAAEDGLEWVVSVDRLKNMYDNRPRFDPLEDVVLAEVDGRTVGYSEVYWFKEPDGTFATPHRERVRPDWRGKGITEALLSISTDRARALAAVRAEGPWRMGTMVADTEVHRRRLLEAAGYHQERCYLEMLRDLGDPIKDHPLPEGIEVRPAAPRDRRRVFEAMWEAYRDTWAFREMTEKDWTGYKGSPEYQPEHWVVGWDGDQVAGVVMCWVDEEENARHGRRWGFNDEVAVARPYRRRGLARALVSRSLVVLRGLGMELANLGVDTQNPAEALSLYSSLGYTVRKEYYDLIRPMD
jgi:GNAT superfamily N-acetyltransferase